MMCFGRAQPKIVLASAGSSAQAVAEGTRRGTMTELRAGISDVWKKSSLSGGAGCVEVRRCTHGVQIRDSKDQGGPVLTFTTNEWKAFLEGVQLGEFQISTSTVNPPKSA